MKLNHERHSNCQAFAPLPPIFSERCVKEVNIAAGAMMKVMEPYGTPLP